MAKKLTVPTGAAATPTAPAPATKPKAAPKGAAAAVPPPAPAEKAAAARKIPKDAHLILSPTAQQLFRTLRDGEQQAESGRLRTRVNFALALVQNITKLGTVGNTSTAEFAEDVPGVLREVMKTACAEGGYCATLGLVLDGALRSRIAQVPAAVERLHALVGKEPHECFANWRNFVTWIAASNSELGRGEGGDYNLVELANAGMSTVAAFDEKRNALFPKAPGSSGGQRGQRDGAGGSGGAKTESVATLAGMLAAFPLWVAERRLEDLQTVLRVVTQCVKDVETAVKASK